jgi:lipopolysaccharide export system ATP-binding protein
VEDIQSIVATLKNKNIGVIITDHNVDETLAITDRTYLLYEGKILKAGTAEDLANDEMVRQVYLGKNFQLRKPAVIETLDEKEPKEELVVDTPAESATEPAVEPVADVEPATDAEAAPNEQNNTVDNG